MAPDEPERPEDDRPSGPDAGEPVEPGPDAGEPVEPGPPPTSELRAKDLIGRSRAELEAELDPATMAELASWFARPSATEARAHDVPDEVRAGASQRDLDDFERLAQAMGFVDEDRSGAMAAAMAAIEPAMLELFDRHTRAADTIVPARAQVEPVLDESIVPKLVRDLLLDEGESLPALGEARAIAIPHDIEALLARDNAPQAVLRDLSRPVEEFELRLEPAFPPPPAEEDMTHAIRDALRWRPEPLPRIERLGDVRAEWRLLHRQPWPEIVAAAKAVRNAEIEAADAQMQAEAEAGIVWRF